MRKITCMCTAAIVALIASLPIACRESNATPAQQTIGALNLKRGALISCGNTDPQFGTLAFDITGSEASKKDFQLGVKLLHSFEYDEAEKVFTGIIDKEPSCAMA